MMSLDKMLIKTKKTLFFLLFNFVFLFLIYFFRDSFKFNSIIITFYFGVFYYFYNLRLPQQILNLFEKVKRIKNKKTLSYFLLLTIIFLIIIFQNSLINFETMDWDVSTYLVVANDIGNGNLPYENQWDDKGPVLYFFFYLLSTIANNNFLLFKLLSDLVIIMISINLFYLIYLMIKKDNIVTPFIGTIVYVLMMALPWANVEYSEVYALFFISFSLIIFHLNKNKKINIIISGILFGLSTLTNQGAGIFIFAYLLLIYFYKKNIKDVIYFCLGVSLPHLFFLFLYIFNNSIDIYLTTLFSIPLSYSSSTSFNIFIEFKNFIRDLYTFNIFFFMIISFLLVIKIFEYKDYIFKENNKIQYNNDLFLISSILFYLIASTGYKHHLLFFFFFISMSVISLRGVRTEIFLFIIVFVGSLSIFPNYYQESKNNLLNLETVYESYPIRKAAIEIQKNIDKNNYTVLALDYQILNYYLDKPNLSKIIHPTNYTEESILKELRKINYITKREIDYLLEDKPDVIICSGLTNEIIDNFNCEVTDYFQDYKKLDLDQYFNDPNRSYYKDVYRTLYVFIKSNS